jgi:hypothetical protein
LQKNSLMKQAIQMSRLELNRGIPHMYWHGHLEISRRRFQRHHQDSQNYFSTKDFRRTNLFACKCLHMQRLTRLQRILRI